MSSPNAAVAPAGENGPAATASPPPAAPRGSASATADALAATIETALREGAPGVLDAEALQRLLAAVCRLYSAKIEAGEPLLPCAPQAITATDAMTVASGLLRAANLAVFELGMWQNLTGR